MCEATRFTLSSLNADETLRRREFPICADRIFLAHAAVAPAPTRVIDAQVAFAHLSGRSGPDEYTAFHRDLRGTREVAARLIGASADEIALLGPTSLGLSLIAAGLEWKAGDEVLYNADDYPANVYPWLNLRRQGVTVKPIPTERPGELTVACVEAALTPRTRLVALASAFFLNGYRIAVDAIGRLLRSRGVLFSLDAIQTLGAFPLSIGNVDFLCADAHKWLLGPCSAGIMYIKREHFERLRPVLLGAANVRSPDFISNDDMIFLDSAARYEPGVLNIGPLLGMRAGMELLMELGIDAVAARISSSVTRLADGLERLGFELYSARGSAASGLLAASHPAKEAGILFRHLKSNDVTVSSRRDRAGRTFLRFSPHFYNTDGEIDQALALLQSAL